MIKGEIKATANKHGKAILFANESNPSGAWVKCDDNSFKFAHKGLAYIDTDDKGIINKVNMIDAGDSSKVTSYLNQPPSQVPSKDRERLIVRQSCLKAAVEMKPADIADALEIAEKFEEWVYR